MHPPAPGTRPRDCRRLDLLHRAGADELPALDDGHLVAELFGDLEHVRREEDRAADVAQLAHHALEQVRRLRVEADERFVHDDELRVVDPRRDDGELLLHAVRVRADRLTEIARELECVGIRLYARPALRGRDAENVGNEVQVLDAAHEIVQIRIVRDVGEQLLAGQRLGLDGVPADRDLARVKLQDADGRLERRRLAGAVVADEAVDLARRDVQAQVVDGPFLAVGLGKMLNVEHDVSS